MSIFFDHHIIPELFRGHDAFNGIDQKMFDIDSPENRIYLPGDRSVADELNMPPHPGRHVSSYRQAVCKALNEIALIESPTKRAEEIRTLVDAMRVGFLNGDLYPNVPIGKTREDVDRSNAKVLTDHKAYLDQYPDRLKTIRDLERRGTDAGQEHLIKWLLLLDNPERQKQLDKVIARNPGFNITPGNRDLDGTRWRSKFAVTDHSSGDFRLPGLAAPSADDLPALPGYKSPPLSDLNQQEGFTQSDPRFTGVLPPVPAPDPNEQRLGQLPPSTSPPSDPLVLKFDPASGAPLPFLERSPVLDPDAPSNATPPSWLYGVAGLAALAAVAPGFWPLWGALGIGLAGTAPARATGAQSSGGGVFSTGAYPFNAFEPSNPVQTSGSNTLWHAPGSLAEAEGAGTFADRFGSWIGTPAGIMPAEDVQQAPPPAAGAIAPEEARRLTRVNAANAGSAFASGSAPVPYLPSTEFNDRFGSWSTSAGRGQPQQPSGSIGAFADEPSYIIPPPIFGTNDPGASRNDAEAWFSRWVRPLLRPE